MSISEYAPLRVFHGSLPMFSIVRLTTKNSDLDLFSRYLHKLILILIKNLSQ